MDRRLQQGKLGFIYNVKDTRADSRLSRTLRLAYPASSSAMLTPWHPSKSDQPSFVIQKSSTSLSRVSGQTTNTHLPGSLKLLLDDVGCSPRVSQTPNSTLDKHGRAEFGISANVLRYNVTEKLNLGEFQLSQSYPFFYDKMEKANYYLESALSPGKRVQG